MMNAKEPNVEKYWDVLREVMDPEYPVSIVDMGLINSIHETEGTVTVNMTYTATSCPCMEWIETDMKKRLLQEPEVNDLKIEVVWDPPWTVNRLSEDAREIMKRLGVGLR